MVSLLDLNVLLALAWPNHVHHERAVAWFTRERGRGWATCPTTQAGFVRLSSNERFVPTARPPREAAELLRRFVALPGHHFWPDDTSILDSSLVALDRIVGHRQVSDAHLLAIALRHRGRLATTDRGVHDLLPPDANPDAVYLLPLLQ